SLAKDVPCLSGLKSRASGALALGFLPRNTPTRNSVRSWATMPLIAPALFSVVLPPAHGPPSGGKDAPGVQPDLPFTRGNITTPPVGASVTVAGNMPPRPLSAFFRPDE